MVGKCQQCCFPSSVGLNNYTTYPEQGRTETCVQTWFASIFLLKLMIFFFKSMTSLHSAKLISLLLSEQGT